MAEPSRGQPNPQIGRDEPEPTARGRFGSLPGAEAAKGLTPSMPPSRVFLAALIFLVLPALATILADRPASDSRFDPWTIGTASLAVGARILLARRRGFRPIPVLDLPLLGVVFVATGGGDSPFDPALFLVYSLLALFLEREPKRLSTVRYATGYLAGVVAMYGIVLGATWLDQRARFESERAEVARDAELARLEPPPVEIEGAKLEESLRIALTRLRDAGEIASDSDYFDPEVEGGVITDARAWLEALRERRAALERARRAIDPFVAGTGVADVEAELERAFDRTEERIVAINDRWRAELASASVMASGTAVSPDPIFAITNESALVEAAFRRLEEIEAAQNTVARDLTRFLLTRRKGLEELEREQGSIRRALVIERLTLAILVLATLALVAGLRAHYEDEVRRHEAARAAEELRRKQEETENWIAVTAGFTHTIGNDILAYDAVSEEALEIATGAGPGIPGEIVAALRFIRESNKQRVGFIRFLEEFARLRKQRLDGQPFRPESLVAIDLEKLLREERDHVGRVEVLDLPESSADARAARLRKRFAELPLEIVFFPDAPESRTLSRGRAAVLQFFAYELFKNALRNCSGERPLRVEIDRRRGRVVLRFVNDLEIVRVPDPSGVDGFVRKLPRFPDRVARSDAELAAIVRDVLARGFEPHVGGGTGLGLFLIRYFVAEYYSGSIRAELRDPVRFEVAFELDVPDDLAAAPTDPEARE